MRHLIQRYPRAPKRRHYNYLKPCEDVPQVSEKHIRQTRITSNIPEVLMTSDRAHA